MRLVVIFFFCTAVLLGQVKTPFKAFDPATTLAYGKEKKAIEQQNLSLIEEINERIKLASSFKHQEDLIKNLEQKISLEGENARLRYLLGGANGIKALEVSKMFSIPYVKAMLFNFERSVELNPNYLPALEAYIEALSMVPGLLGGSMEKATQLANNLMDQNKEQAYFSLGFIAAAKGQEKEARLLYIKALEHLQQKELCDQNLADYFLPFSMNYPYKIAAISAQQKAFSSLGLCAINQFIAGYSPFHNLPLEWAFYQKARLLYQLNEKNAAMTAIEKALSINPTFEIGKSWKVHYQ
ncbi:MAG: hypothetical protein ACPG8F_05655 [Flavobacteriaceae bacterium]